MPDESDKWLADFRLFADEQRRRHPVPRTDNLSSVDQTHARLLGSHLIQWLEEWGPRLLADRAEALRTVEIALSEPMIVYISDGPGLAAAADILAPLPPQIRYLYPREYRIFETQRPDLRFHYHCTLQSHMEQPDDPTALRHAFGLPAHAPVWMHYDCTTLTDRLSRGARHLWTMRDSQPVLLQEAREAW